MSVKVRKYIHENLSRKSGYLCDSCTNEGEHRESVTGKFLDEIFHVKTIGADVAGAMWLCRPCMDDVMRQYLMIKLGGKV